MKKLLIWSRVPYYNHCPCRFCYHRAKNYHPNRCPLPTLYLRQNLICPQASRLHLKELLSILQTVSSCSRYTTFLLFGSRFHRQNLPQRSPLFTHLPHQIEISLNADVSGNTLPFVSPCINNFSDYDISQIVDWECPSLTPHVLLLTLILTPSWKWYQNVCHAVFWAVLAFQPSLEPVVLIDTLPSSCMASPVSGRLFLRSLSTIGFHDVTETNGSSSLWRHRDQSGG